MFSWGTVRLRHVSTPNLHKLVFTPEANAHGEFEIEFLVYDGEHISAEEDPGTLVIEVASVNDAPEDPTITGDRDDAMTVCSCWWR